MTLKLLPAVYAWQKWNDDHNPTDAELGAMSEEEYDDYIDCLMRTAKQNHPAQGARK
jgi:hypothetical protein